MSVINKMLQDLDRRNAAGVEAEAPARPVKAAVVEHHGHEWFWRVIALLVLVSVSWVAWVAYQLQPRSIATEQTLRIAMQPRSSAVTAAAGQPAPLAAAPVEAATPAPVATPGPVAAPAPAAPAPAPMPVKAEEPKPEAAKPPAETFKLAREIATPIAERKSPPPKAEAKKPAPVVVPKTVQAQKDGAVDKRASPKPVAEAGEEQFQRAAAFLKQGRLSEAQDQLVAALQAHPNHLGARQAYVALLLEQQRVDEALGALREAVALNPGHPAFLLTLARVHAEQRDYKSALEVMDKAGPVAEGADFLTLRGAVLRRLGRHADAVGAYQKAVQSGPQPGETWTGLAISLEAVGRSAEAAQAYQRALGAGRLPREVREYAEARVKALQ
jgi:MSHA biogenesis protein MshN